MYLSRLEILGFKSFAQKSIFQFNDGITAIIGPNGCGKSNIVDAIRWVLGEQRPSLLRLEKMENLIFNGTALRKPLNLVEVSLLIENTKNILPSVYSEVKITRRFYRSGDSEYLLNNRMVRLKDIIDLFTDTGMGSDAYSVIELKMVEQILSDNAEERRRLFEEAAGIKKYKIRRKSALRKLDSTERELIRLNDVMAEIKKTVNSLSRQVGKARRYHQYKNDLKQYEIYIYQLKRKKFNDDLIPLKEEYVQVRETRERLGKDVNQREAELEKLQLKAVDLEKDFREVAARLGKMDEKVRDIQEKVRLNEQKIESIKFNSEDRNREIEESTVRLKEIEHQLEQTAIDKSSIMRDLEDSEHAYRKHVDRHSEAESYLEESRRAYHLFREENVNKISELNSNRENLQRINVELETINQQLQKSIQTRENLESALKNKENGLQECQAVVLRLNNDEKDTRQQIERIQQELAGCEEEYHAFEGEKNALLGNREKLKAKKEFLEALLESYEGFSEGVRYVMAHRKNYNGVFDTLANLVDTRDEYRPALESYLEQIADYLIVEGAETAQHIIDEVRQERKGRLTLVPLSILHPAKNGKMNVDSLDGQAVAFKNIIQFDARFQILFDVLFDRLVLVEDIDTALKFRDKYPQFKYVTKAGDVVGEWGDIRGGDAHRQMNLTGRKKQYKELQVAEKTLNNDLAGIEKNMNLNRQRHQERNNRMEQIRLSLADLQKKQLEFRQRLSQEEYETSRLTERISEVSEEQRVLKDKTDELSAQKSAILPALKDADKQLESIREEESHLSQDFEKRDHEFRQMTTEVQQAQIKFLKEQNKLKEIEQKLAFLENSKTESENRIQQNNLDIINFMREISDIGNQNSVLKNELEVMYDDRDKVENEKNEIENKYQALKSLIISREEESKKLHRRWNQALERLKELELRIQEIELKISSQRDQMDDQYRSELQKLLEENPVPADLDLFQGQEKVNQLRQKLELLGEVNPLAPKEFEKEKERLDFFNNQQEDLLEAKSELLETISKLNESARTQFTKTFDKINQNFREVFGKFFENGQAELCLLENNDPLEANIDVSVHLKGRKLTTLSLLSAGEKTLTAISLLFAIYLYKPSPFCILDEVDAPLDDVNIARYTHALKEFSDNTQFILVTHNKMTMQAAQSMYGVTMEEPGISKVVSVRFD